MKELDAKNRAQRLARYGRAKMYVFKDQCGRFEVGNDFDFHNFFIGQNPIYTFDERGKEVEHTVVAQ